MKKPKEIFDSAFNLDELIQESIEMNNFLKGKTNQHYQEENNFDDLSKFFSSTIKLRNASKNNCWEKSNSSNNVSSHILLIFFIFRHIT
jgi:hypothetical protein